MIPAWNMAGVLPPIRPGQPGHSADRSPYSVTLSNVVEHFSSSPQRTAILEGLLSYRAELHKLGVIDGFQWLDGSFMEDVENQQSRPPNDVDVVTFFHLPSGENQKTLAIKAQQLFSQQYVKQNFLVDAYLQPLGEPTDARHIRQISYWYSMWSHRRDGIWKGFVQINLAPQEDIDAKQLMGIILNGGHTA